MTEATLSIANSETVRAIFGAQDRYLRQIRDSIGVDILLRGDEIRLQGQNSQVDKGMRVLHELQEIVDQRGFVKEWEVDQILNGSPEAKQKTKPKPAPLHNSLRQVQPRTAGQAEYLKAIQNHDMVFCSGPAGCGKTFLAAAMAINALREEKVRKIVLVRPAVEAGERLGFLPGDLMSKVNPYLRPLLDSINDLLDFEQVKRYMENDVIEVVPLAYMRGRTLNDTFMILDEGQNATTTQMKMFLTRMGNDSKVVVTGDITQVDLDRSVTSGLKDAMIRLGTVEGIAAVRLTQADIVRHPLVGRIVDAYENDDKKG